MRKRMRHRARKAHKLPWSAHFKDDSSYYLNHFPQWRLIEAPNAGGIDATSIRRILYETANPEQALDALERLAPPVVREALRSWLASPEYAALAEEYRQVAQYKAAWSAAPYTPIFSTVDAVVTVAGHVLLIRRGGFPGKGQWALPGGFVEPRERLLKSALRELEEETRLAVAEADLRAALRDVKVFDHPERSQRGRTITHAHYFALAGDKLPAVEAADDAAQARWVPIAQLTGMQEEFFEDHLHILDIFLHLFTESS